MGEIFHGRLRAGQRLVTEKLARRFGVSHTPIREALIELAAIGIVEMFPNKGAVVRKVTAKDVREICHVRRILECAATKSACGRIDAAELDRLCENIRDLMATKTPSQAAFIQRARVLDSRLHDRIAASCGNAFLAKELSRLKTLFRAFRDAAWEHDGARNDYHRIAEEGRGAPRDRRGAQGMAMGGRRRRRWRRIFGRASIIGRVGCRVARNTLKPRLEEAGRAWRPSPPASTRRG